VQSSLLKGDCCPNPPAPASPWITAQDMSLLAYCNPHPVVDCSGTSAGMSHEICTSQGDW